MAQVQNGTQNAIDFVKSDRETIKNHIGSAGTEDIMFAEDSGTIFTGTMEFGSYVPASDIVSEGTATSVGGYSGSGATAATLKGKTISEVIDGILFPETAASQGSIGNPSISATINGKVVTSNNTADVPVGSMLTAVTCSAPTSTGKYCYVKEGNSYVKKDYTFTENSGGAYNVPNAFAFNEAIDLVGTASNGVDIVEGNAYTIDTVTGVQANGNLYKSRGGDGGKKPLSGTKTASSVSIKTYYKGAKAADAQGNPTLVDTVRIYSDGVKVDGGSLNVWTLVDDKKKIDNGETVADHNVNGTYTIYTTSNEPITTNSYKLYNPLAANPWEDKDLTLTDTVSTNPKTIVVDENQGIEYDLYKHEVTIHAGNDGGKYQISVKLN